MSYLCPSTFAGSLGKLGSPSTVRTRKEYSWHTYAYIIIFQVEIEGLTGDIRFNEAGRRENYTLHVVEMTVKSAMVKVISSLLL